MSKLNYETLSVEGLKDVLTEVSSSCEVLGIDFFIVGAVARNIWLATNNESTSGTKDIDFGVYIPTVEKYSALRNHLIANHAYVASEENDFCLITSAGKQVDLLPFGEIEAHGKVMIEGRGLREVTLDGFTESFKNGKTTVTLGDESYEVCTIPAVAVLKLIAFDDRPEARLKDIYDLNAICAHYPQIETETIWDNHSDLFDDDREYPEVAMIVLGREVRQVIGANEHLKKRLDKIISDAINEKSSLLKYMIVDTEKETLADKRNLLVHLQIGLLE